MTRSDGWLGMGAETDPSDHGWMTLHRHDTKTHRESVRLGREGWSKTHHVGSIAAHHAERTEGLVDQALLHVHALGQRPLGCLLDLNRRVVTGDELSTELIDAGRWTWWRHRRPSHVHGAVHRFSRSSDAKDDAMDGKEAL